MRPVSFLSIVIAIGVLLAQSGTAPASAQPRQAPATSIQHEVTVALKLIHVYVTDKKGNPVPDLAAADFTVTDNGQPVVLTEFERHSLGAPETGAAPGEQTAIAEGPSRPEAAAVRPAGRKFFLFFDFAFNNVRGILKAQKAALHFLDTVVSPEDELAVLTYATIGGLAFHEYLTTDHAKVRKVIEAISHKDIAGRATQIEDQYWKLLQDSESTPMGTNYRAESEANRQESRSMAQKYMLKLTVLARALRLVQGQKHFIFFSTGVPNSLIYGYTPDNARYRGSVASASGDQVLRRQNEQMYQEFGAAGCSFYAFDTRESAMEESLFTYDEQTFAAGSRSMGTGSDATNVFKDNKVTGLNSLKRITDITGGRYYSNINMYEKNLDRVQNMTVNYYVLGYSVNERWDGQFHDVKVEVKRKGCEVRTQSGYFNPKPYREYSDFEKQIHLFDLALNERAFSRLPVNVPLMALTSAAEGISRLGILAKVPAELTAKISGKRMEFVAIFMDANGDISDLVRQEGDPAAFRGRDMAFAAGAALRPGEYSCRLVVRDMDSGMSAVGAAKATVVKPQITGLQLGTPLVLEARTGCSFLSASSKNAREAFPWAEIYPYDRSLFSPVIKDLPPNTESVQVVIPCAFPGGGQSELAMSANLVNAASGARSPLTVSRMDRVHKGSLEVLSLELPTASIPPGTYFLHFYAQDRATGSLGHAFTTLIISRR